jgi:hypothetical protein
MATRGKGIFLVYTDVDPQHEAEFNDWYNTEHIAELLAVPGILAAARYEAAKGGPKYLAVYGTRTDKRRQNPGLHRPQTHPVGRTCVADRDRVQLNAGGGRTDLSGRH